VAERRLALPPSIPGDCDGLVVLHLPENPAQEAPTGIETDAKSLQAAWTGILKVDCPHCHEAHDISVRDTYIEVVAQEDSDRLYRFR
jgi:hypothetical protein